MAVDFGIVEKLHQLKAKFIDGDDSAKQQIVDWEKRIQELSLKQEFMQNEVTQEASKILKAKIAGHMKYRLKTGLKDIDRAVSDGKEQELRWALGLFNLNYEQELETLENLIDQEL